MPKDKHSCMKPKVVYCIYYPSNISSDSGPQHGGLVVNFTAKHGDFLVLSGTAFSTSVLISSSVIEEKRSISKFVRQTGVIGCERTHAREEIFDIIRSG